MASEDVVGQGEAALAGLRVVEFSTNLIGAHVGQVLADFGAEVTMVEPPGGNPLRAQPAWPFWARGKRSVMLDLAETAQLQTARDLAGSADVVVQTWRPGVAERLGLDYESLSEANDGLVLAAVTGFGQTGPLKDMKAYEAIVMAKVGGLDAFGGITPRPGPAFTSAPFASFSASQVALHGILGALIEREGSGRGQQVDVSLAQSLAAHDTWGWLIAMLLDRYEGAFSPAAPFDNETQTPNSPLFFRLMVGLSQDGRWMQLSQTTDKLWNAFLEMAGMDDVLEAGADPAANEDPAVRVAFWERLLDLLRSESYDHWLGLFDEHPDVWAETFRSGTELLDHPQMVHDNQVVSPEVAGLGPVRQPGPLVKLHQTPGSADGAVPALDEHGAEIRDAPQGGSDDAAVGEGPTDPPLSGVTIVELGTFYAGPFGATLLTDLGARVIKLEPLEGDPIRHIMPFPEVGGIKVLAGKESVAVDINTPEGKGIALELIGRADVVLQCFRAGVPERLGLDFASVREVNPDLVYLNAPGYGTSGPYGHRPAFAPTIGAGSGLAMRNIGPSVSEHPEKLDLPDVKAATARLSQATMGYAHSDGFSALGVATGLLLAILARKRGGPAQEATTTMLSTLAHALGEGMIEYADCPPLAEADAELHGLSALYRLYPADDGWVFLAAPQPGEWGDLVEALASWTDLGSDERFADAGSRAQHDGALAETLAAVFAQRSPADWEADLVGRDVACVEVTPGPIERIVTSDEGLGREHGYLVDREHETLGEYIRLAPIVRFSRSEGLAGEAPLAGRDTDAVLAEIGYDEERIGELRERGVLGG